MGRGWDSMAFGFVTQSKGHIKLRSEVGQGTTVEIDLPRDREAKIVATAPVSKPRLPSNLRCAKHRRGRLSLSSRTMTRCGEPPRRKIRRAAIG